MAKQTKKTEEKKQQETVSIQLNVPKGIYYPMKDDRDARHRKGEAVLLHDEFVELIKIGYDKKKKSLVRRDS